MFKAFAANEDVSAAPVNRVFLFHSHSFDLKHHPGMRTADLDTCAVDVM